MGDEDDREEKDVEPVQICLQSGATDPYHL